MNQGGDRIVIHGHVHLSLRTVARCYDVQVTWLEEVFELGLLGSGESVADGIVVAATQLDQVARIVRLHFYDGVNLEGIAVLLRQRRV